MNTKDLQEETSAKAVIVCQPLSLSLGWSGEDEEAS